MVNDTIAEKLEARGFWRRAASRWLDVMQDCATDAQRDWISQRRRYCLSMLTSPRPDNKLDIGTIAYYHEQRSSNNPLCQAVEC